MFCSALAGFLDLLDRSGVSEVWVLYDGIGIGGPGPVDLCFASDCAGRANLYSCI